MLEIAQPQIDRDWVHSYKSYDAEYATDFALFALRTNQKHAAIAYLTRVIEQRRKRQLLVDVGAGDGTITAPLSAMFDSTIAIEPNRTFAAGLRDHGLGIGIIERTVFAARVPACADFVLCSHVLFHVPEKLWMMAIAQMVSWLDRDGELCVLLQTVGTDCRDLLRDFGYLRSDLRELGEAMRRCFRTSIEIDIVTLPCEIVAPVEEAPRILQFMLNEISELRAIPMNELRDYADARFRKRGYVTLTCHQDVLRVRRVRRSRVTAQADEIVRYLMCIS